MTKTELKEFLMKLKEQAVQTVRDEFNLKRENVIREYIKTNNLEPEIKRIAENLSRTKFECDKLKAKVQIPTKDWSNIFDKIDDFIVCSSNHVDFITLNFSYKNIEGYREIMTLEDKSVVEVKKTYDTVIRNVTALKNVKQALEYVKELGFEVPEEEKRKADLMVPVDTRFLIAKGGK